MKSLLNFIYKYHYFILFIVLQCLSFFFIIQYNDYQRASFLNSSNKVSGNLYNSFYSVSQYFGLKKANQDLIAEISKLQNNQKGYFKDNTIKLSEIYDSIFVQQYQSISAQVINNSVNKQNNYLTLNKGLKHGVGSGMAVVSVNGIVGIVKDASYNYSSVVSVLNQNLKISAMVKKNGYFGTLNWNGLNYRYVTLNDLPNHISINKGDTIITSGYSTMFPKGEIIGIVDDVEDSKSGEFYDVTVLLAEDFKSLSHVLIIKNLLKEEQLQLERSSSND